MASQCVSSVHPNFAQKKKCALSKSRCVSTLYDICCFVTVLLVAGNNTYFDSIFQHSDMLGGGVARVLFVFDVQGVARRNVRVQKQHNHNLQSTPSPPPPRAGKKRARSSTDKFSHPFLPLRLHALIEASHFFRLKPVSFIRLAHTTCDMATLFPDSQLCYRDLATAAHQNISRGRSYPNHRSILPCLQSLTPGRGASIPCMACRS